MGNINVLLLDAQHNITCLNA